MAEAPGASNKGLPGPRGTHIPVGCLFGIPGSEFKKLYFYDFMQNIFWAGISIFWQGGGYMKHYA
jgi:hypothetical protein